MDLYPHLHTRPATGWINDPNGIGFWDGEWHVMMQWNPTGTRWGDIHWAHLTSHDLLTWTEQPPALRPREDHIDSGGAWSGVATMNDAGRPVLVYSATPAGPDEIVEAVAHPDPDDPYAWVQPETPALPSLTTSTVKDVRDPFIFHHEGRRLALLGSRVEDRGEVLLFDATDLDAWRPLGTLFAHAAAGDASPDEPNFWECPQLVRVGHSWVLVISLTTIGDGTIATHTFSVPAFAGSLVADGEGYRFEARAWAPLDHGTDFYAPQLFDAGDRVLAWGWCPEGRGAQRRSDQDIDASGWAGTLSFPREVRLDDAGVPVLRPAPELAGLRGQELHVANGVLATEEPAWVARVGGPWRLEIAGPEGTREVLVGEGGAVWVDGSIVEAFGMDGATTSRAYPGEGEHWVLKGSGPIHANQLRLPT